MDINGGVRVIETSVAINEEIKKTEKKVINVGLIMPIAEISGLSEQHWEDVKRIIIEAIKSDEEYEMKVRLVSHSDEVRVIQTSIVQNIYNDDIVIIDVSAKNANVMFEFGMRLAFDKAFVVIKDDATPYIFDTGNIQHLEYPRDLRYTRIEAFKATLRDKVINTLEHALANKDKSLYLEQYGDLKPSKIEGKEVDVTEYFERSMNSLRKDIRRLEEGIKSGNNKRNQNSSNNYINDDIFYHALSLRVQDMVKEYIENTERGGIINTKTITNLVKKEIDNENLNISNHELERLIMRAIDDY